MKKTNKTKQKSSEKLCCWLHSDLLCPKLLKKKKKNPSILTVYLSEAQLYLNIDGESGEDIRYPHMLCGTGSWDWILAELGTFHGPGVMGAFLLIVVPLQLGSWMLLLEPLGSFLFTSSPGPRYLLSRYSLSPLSLPLLRLRVLLSASDAALSLWIGEYDFCASCSALLPFLWRSLVPQLLSPLSVAPLSCQ